MVHTVSRSLVRYTFNLEGECSSGDFSVGYWLAVAAVVTGQAFVGGLLGEFFRGLAKRGLLLGELFRARGRRGVAGRVLYRLAPEKGCVSLDTTLQQRLQRLATAPAVAPLAQPPAPRAATAPASQSADDRSFFRHADDARALAQGEGRGHRHGAGTASEHEENKHVLGADG